MPGLAACSSLRMNPTLSASISSVTTEQLLSISPKMMMPNAAAMNSAIGMEMLEFVWNVHHWLYRWPPSPTGSFGSSMASLRSTHSRLPSGSVSGDTQCNKVAPGRVSNECFHFSVERRFACLWA